MEVDKQGRRSIRLFITMMILCAISCISTTTTRQELNRGFIAVHDASYAEFQPFLSDPTAVFSLGFLRVNSTHQLQLAVIHLPSSFSIWRANGLNVSWSTNNVFISFDGALTIFDNSSSTKKLLWSTPNNQVGDRLILLNSSNLQLQAQDGVVVWQSFDFPSDTLVENQKFTSSSALSTPDNLFSMRLTEDYLALYMSGHILYWKHTAMEAKAQIVEGGGNLYAVVETSGFLGMYQSSQTIPVDVISFDTFNRDINGFRRLTIENDGNLRAYYWNGYSWKLEFSAINVPCGLPTICGPYGLCAISGDGKQHCSCLLNDNYNTSSGSGVECESIARSSSNDLCLEGEGKYDVLRRQGVDLAIDKELVVHQRLGSAMECEAECENNCTCWGVAYNNATGYCYWIDYPIQTLVEADDRKFVYLKFMFDNHGSAHNKGEQRVKLALLVVGIVVLCVGAMFGAFRAWQRMRQRRDYEDDGDQTSSLPYKNLSSASFRSIELSSTSSK